MKGFTHGLILKQRHTVTRKCSYLLALKNNIILVFFIHYLSDV